MAVNSIGAFRILAVAAALFGAAAGPLEAQAADLSRADSLFRAGAHDAARVAYEEVLREAPNNSRAVFQLAILASWRNALDSALVLHRRYLVLEPSDLEGRVALARTMARMGDFRASVAQYDTVLAREADYRDAALGRGIALGWWGRFAEADAWYRAWIDTHPADTVAALERARVLSWAGSFDAALAIYDRYAGSSDAAKGRARVLTWRGDLVGGEADWVALTRRYPRDPEVWVGLGQVRRWLGRPRASQEALRTALEIVPGYDDARQQLRWVDAELRPSAGLDVVVAEDSDGNQMQSVAISGAIAPPIGRRILLTGLQRSARLGALETTVRGLRAGWGVQSSTGQVQLAGDLAVQQLDGEATPTALATERSIVSGSVRAATQLGTRLSLGAGFQRAPFDEVAAAIRSGVVLQHWELDGSLRLPSRLFFGGAVGSGTVQRGAQGDNDRWSGSANLRWQQSRAASVAVRTRAFGHARTTTDGYFSPRRFQLTELALHFDRPRDLGWQWSGDVATGRQRLQVRGDAPVTTRGAWSAWASLGYRPRPGVEWFVRSTIANVASPGTVLGDTEYRYGSVSAGGRWLF